MRVLDEFPKYVTRSGSKVTSIAKILMGVRKYVVENISKIVDIIMEALEIP
jgi:hypothetical protein